MANAKAKSGGKFSKSGVRSQVKLVSTVDNKFYARSEIYKAQQIERFAGFKTHCSKLEKPEDTIKANPKYVKV